MKLAGLLLLMIVIAAGCKDAGGEPVSPPSPGTGVSVSFSDNVLPILRNHGCTGCHGGTNNLYVTSVAGLLQGGLHGPAVISFRADSSILIQKVGPNPPFGTRMPQGGEPVSDQDVKVLKDWINQGSKDN